MAVNVSKQLKKTITNLAVVITAVIVLGLFSYTAEASSSRLVSISMQVNKQVVVEPNLYEHLQLMVRVSQYSDGRESVQVLDSKMDNIDGPITIGRFRPGSSVYVFFDILLDGVETHNEYQKSRVETSYEFYTESAKELRSFQVVVLGGTSFDDMINLNPGDDMNGVIRLDIGRFITSDPGDDPDDPTEPEQPSEPDTPVIPIAPVDPVLPPVQITPDTPSTDVPTIEVGDGIPKDAPKPGGKVPKTFDETPIEVFAAIFAISGMLLLIQIILFIRSSRKEERT